MDVRLTSEQQQLREAAAKLADDLGPGSVQISTTTNRIARLEKAVDATGLRSLRSDGASGVEVAIVAEEFARGLVDVPFLGPVMADELARRSARKYRVRRSRSVTGPSMRGDMTAPCCSPARPCWRRSRIRRRRCGFDQSRKQVAGSPQTHGELAAEPPNDGMPWRWPSPPPTWSEPRAARTRWPASTPRSANSTARPSGPIRPSGTCLPKALPSSRVR